MFKPLARLYPVLTLFIILCLAFSCLACAPSPRTGVAFDGQQPEDELRKRISLALFGKENGFSRKTAQASLIIRFSQNGFETGSTVRVYNSPRFLVERSILVPVTELLSTEYDVTLASCRNRSHRLVSLDSIPVGMRAMTVSGAWVGQNDYPLWSGWTVSIEQKNYDLRTRAEFDRLCRALGTVEECLPPIPRLTWIAAMGDLMLERGAGTLLAEKGAQASFGSAHAILETADCAVANLEGAISSRGRRATKSYTFRYPPSAALDLAKAGFDALLLANNHAFDWGSGAFEDTCTNLYSAGIAPLGAGQDFESASRAAIIDSAAGRIRLWGLASYPREKNGWDSSLAAAGKDRPGILRASDGGAKAIAAGFEDDSLNLVFFHGGEEWSTGPDAQTRTLGHSLIDAGADAIYGSHPHVVQGLEMYKGKPIFWSLGNGLFPGMQDTKGGEIGLLVQSGFLGKQLVYLRPYPLRLHGPQVDIDTGAHALDQFISRSKALK